MIDNNDNDFSGRDPELEKMLEPLRNEPPTEMDIKRWQRSVTALDKQRTGKYGRLRLWSLLTAAAGLGAIVGAGVTRSIFSPEPQEPVCAQDQLFAEHRDVDATFETTYIKLD